MRKLVAVALLTCAMSAPVMAGEYDQPGFVTHVEDGRLWIFKAGSKHLKMFEKTGEPAKQYTIIGEGPEGMTVKAADLEVLNTYLKQLK